MPIDLVGPDGQQYELDNEDPAALDEALRQGFKQPVAAVEESAADDAFDTLGAGALGAVEGVTGGLFGTALGSSDELKLQAQVAQRAKAENPIAAGVGELAGMVASPLNAIGGAATQAVRATTRLGRIGAEALGGGLSNMLFGAGKELSDASLGNTQLSAEKVIAGAGLGAVLGLAGGGLGRALGEGVSAASSAASSALSKPLGGAKEALLRIRDTFGMKAAGAMGKEFKAAAHRGNTRELVDLLIEKKILKPGGKLDDVAEAAEKLAAETNAEKVALEKLLESKGAMVDGAKAADEIEKLATKFGKGNVGDKAIAKRLIAEADALRVRGEMPFTAAEDAKRGFDKYLEFGAEQSPMQEGLKQARGILNRVNEEVASKVGGDDAARWLKTKKEMGLLAQVADFSTARAEAIKANRFISLTDYITGGGGGVAGAIMGGDENRLEGALTGAGLALGNKVLRERLPSLIAKAADDLAKSPALSRVAESFAKSIPAVAGKVGPYGSLLAQAAARSPAHALATHMAYAQTDESYRATTELAGLVPEDPEEHEAVMARATDIAALGDHLKQQDDAIGRHIDHVLKGTKPGKMPAGAMKTQDFGSRRMRRDSEAAYQRRVEEIRQLATDPNALVDRIAGNAGRMGQVAPGVSAAMTASAQRAVQYLAKAAEEPPKAGPLAPDWVPNEEERYRFEQKLEAVQDPMSVFRHAAAGTLTEDQVEAFRAVYPTLAQQAADMALERIAENPKNVPYHSMVMLSLLTGVDMDGSMSPEAIQANQRAIHGTVEPPSGAPPSSGAPKSDMTLASRLATPGQRREMEPE